jgi:hypothetical protein
MPTALIVVLALGVVLPPLGAAALIVIAWLRGNPAGLRMAVAFSKGILLGALGGLVISGLAIGAVLGLVWLRGR